MSSVQWLMPQIGLTDAYLLLQTETYNLAFNSYGDTQAYLASPRFNVPAGDLTSSAVELPLSLNGAMQVQYHPEYGDAAAGSSIGVQAEDGTHLADSVYLSPGESFWVTRGKYDPVVSEMALADDMYVYYLQGHGVDWTGDQAQLSVGSLLPPSVALSSPSAVPGQELVVRTPYLTDRGYELTDAWALMGGGDPVSINAVETLKASLKAHARLVPSREHQGRWLTRTLKPSGQPVVQYTDPTPPGEDTAVYSNPYLKITSDLDGSVLYWDEWADYGDNRITLPSTGVPGAYTVETGVVRLGPIWRYSDQVKATTSLSFGNTLSSGMRVRVIEPDGKAGQSDVYLYRKITAGTQQVYDLVDYATTDVLGVVFFNQNVAGDYMAVAIPADRESGYHKQYYELQGSIKVKGDLVLDARTALPFKITALRPDPYGSQTAPMPEAFLYLTPLDSKGVALDTLYVGNTSAGGSDSQPVGTRVVWVTPGDYKLAAVDSQQNFQLASPDKVTVKAGSTSYTFPTAVGKLTIEPPHHDFQPAADVLMWRSFIRPTGSYVSGYWQPSPSNQGPMFVWVTPGSYEVWTEWVQGTAPITTEEGTGYQRGWAYIMSSPAVSVPRINLGDTNAKTVKNGGAFEANIVGPKLTKNTLTGQVSVQDSYGNNLRSIGLTDFTAPGQLLTTSGGATATASAGRLKLASTVMRQSQLAGVLRTSSSIKVNEARAYPYWGEPLAPRLQVTDPTYAVSGQNNPDWWQWYFFTYTPPTNGPAGTYSVQLVVPVSDAGPAISDPVTIGVGGKGPGHLQVSQHHFTPGSPQGMTIRYNPVAAGSVTFSVVDATGKTVRSWPAQSVKLGDSLSLTWDGTDNQKRTVANGDYRVVANQGGQVAAEAVKINMLDIGTAWIDYGPLALNDPEAFVLASLIPTKPVHATIAVVDSNDEPVRYLGYFEFGPLDSIVDSQPISILWDGRNQDDQLVAPGTYSFKFTDLDNPDQVYYLDVDVVAQSPGYVYTPGSQELVPWYSFDGANSMHFVYVGAAGPIKATVVDLKGNELVTMTKSVPTPPAGYSWNGVAIDWNGMVNGQVLAPGMYRLKVTRDKMPTVYTDFGIRPFAIGQVSLSTDTFLPTADASSTLSISLMDFTLPAIGTTVAKYTVKIQTPAGVDVATLMNNWTPPADAMDIGIDWNGRDNKGKFVPDGNYQVVIINSLVVKNPVVVPFRIQGVTVPAPRIDQVPSLVNTSSPTVTGTALPGAVITFTVDGKLYATAAKPPVPITATADETGVWTMTFPGLKDGLHKVQAAQTSPISGFTSAVSAAAAFTVDTVRPTITLKAPLKQDQVVYVTNGAVMVTGTASDAQMPMTLDLYDGSAITSQTVATDKTKAFKFNLKLADGTYAGRLRATDPAGNEGDSVFFGLVVDTKAPEVTSPYLWTGDDTSVGSAVLPVDTTYDSQGRLTAVKYVLTAATPIKFGAAFTEVPVAGTLKIGTTVLSTVEDNGEIRLFQSTTGNEWVPMTIPANGQLNFSLEGKDAAGNLMKVAVSITVDNKAPTFTPSTSVPMVSAKTGSQPASLKFTASEAFNLATLQVYRREALPDGSWSEPIPVEPLNVALSTNKLTATVQVPTDELMDGAYQYAVRAEDAVGNVIADSALTWSPTVKVDRTAPEVTFTSPTTATGGVYTLQATLADARGIAKVTVGVRNGSSTTLTLNAPTSYSLTRRLTLPFAQNTVFVTVVDTLGNVTTSEFVVTR
jgi:flagellar hook assembly protein FlgD